MIALCRPSDCHQSFVAVVLGLVDFNDTATELANLVDLGAAFANDGSDHVVGNENLLRQRLARDHALHWLGRGTGMTWVRRMADLWSRLMRSCARVARLLRRALEVDGSLWLLRLCRLTVIRNAVRRVSLPWIILSPVIVRMAIISSNRLRYVGHDLHTTRNDTGRSTASRRVRGRGRPTKTFRELLHQRLSDIVTGNVHGIRDTEYHQRALR